MNINFPIVKKIKWVYPPNVASVHNSFVDTKLSKIDSALFTHESQLTSLDSFTQVYARKHPSLKLEYERKIFAIEKSLIDQNNKLETTVKEWKHSVRIYTNILFN